eukprot:5792225-Lingulodinium_polyedra.AAC.1
MVCLGVVQTRRFGFGRRRVAHRAHIRGLRVALYISAFGPCGARPRRFLHEDPRGATLLFYDHGLA